MTHRFITSQISLSLSQRWFLGLEIRLCRTEWWFSILKPNSHQTPATSPIVAWASSLSMVVSWRRLRYLCQIRRDLTRFCEIFVGSCKISSNLIEISLSPPWQSMSKPVHPTLSDPPI